jgi:putative membrane protein
MNRTVRYAAVSLLTIGPMACGGKEPPARTAETPIPSRSSASAAPAATAQDTTTTPGSATLPSSQGAIGSGPPSTAAPTSGATVPLSDDQILYVMQTANAGEIEQAKIAQQKANNGRVKRFAAMMLKDHGDADNKGREVARKTHGSPSPSEVSKNLETTARQMTASMSSQQGADFDRSYIDAQVKAHQSVLDLIDKQLLPNATATEVKEMLKDIRPKIEAHLREAQEIQKGLGGV